METENEITTYYHHNDSYEISFPSSWSFTMGGNTLMFYNPDVQGELELSQGMKIEIVALKKSEGQRMDQQIRDIKDFGRGVVTGPEIQYINSTRALQFIERAPVYTMMTFLENESLIMNITGYIPREETRVRYEEEYQRIIQAFRFR